MLEHVPAIYDSLIVTILGAIVAALAPRLMRFLDARTVAILRGIYAEAIARGAAIAVEGRADDPIAATVAYVHERVPDAVRGLKASRTATGDIAALLIHELTNSRVPPARALSV